MLKQGFYIRGTVDHHSLEYGPSNKNLFQTMGVFHTMGSGRPINRLIV